MKDATLAPRQPLVRITQGPQRPGGVDVAQHATIVPIAERRGAVLLSIVERHPLRKMGVRSGWLSREDDRR